jgi:hypothetical protein
MKRLFISAAVLIGLVLIGQKVFEARDSRLLRVAMHLAPGAAGLPTADAMIDFENDTAYCRKVYGPAAQGDTVFSLSRHTISRLLDLAERTNWQKFQREFRKKGDSLPESTTTIFMSNDTIVVKDYGLVGDVPLQDFYQALYQLGHK